MEISNFWCCCLRKAQQLLNLFAIFKFTDFESVIFCVQSQDMFSLLEEVNLHVTESLLQFGNFFFPLSQFPLRFMLEIWGKQNICLHHVKCFDT